MNPLRFTALADSVAARYGTLHFDAADHPYTYERSMWSVDRLHPSERGHRLLATLEQHISPPMAVH